MKKTTKSFFTFLLISTTSLSAFGGNFLPKMPAPTQTADKSMGELVALSLRVYSHTTTLESIQSKFSNLSTNDSCFEDAWEFGTNFINLLDLPDDGWSAWYATNWYYETHCQ